MARTHHYIAGFLSVCILFQNTPISADQVQGKLAIIAAKDEKAESVADLLTAEFSKAGGIELVERDRINAVLKELNLNAAGLVSPDERARLGAIVAADVVLFVEQAAKVQPPLLHVPAVESRTGVSLLELDRPATDIDAVTSAAARLTREALSRAKTQVESRLFIAFTGVRSEEPGNYLLPTAQALTAFMRQDLYRTPGVFLLERSRLHAAVTRSPDLATSPTEGLPQRDPPSAATEGEGDLRSVLSAGSETRAQQRGRQRIRIPAAIGAWPRRLRFASGPDNRASISSPIPACG